MKAIYSGNNLEEVRVLLTNKTQHSNLRIMLQLESRIQELRQQLNDVQLRWNAKKNSFEKILDNADLYIAYDSDDIES